MKSLTNWNSIVMVPLFFTTFCYFSNSPKIAKQVYFQSRHYVLPKSLTLIIQAPLR